MEEIMLPDLSKSRGSRAAALFLAVVGGLVILITLYSVKPTASRFESSAPWLGSVGPPAAHPGQVLPVESVFDYSLVFPEQPSPATR
jgi:hypothetical protein